MPTISIFYGMVVQMYWREHPPAHVHVFYRGDEALIAIEDGRLLAGRLPPSGLRLVQDWIDLRRGDLVMNWERGRAKLPFNQIQGADDDD